MPTGQPSSPELRPDATEELTRALESPDHGARRRDGYGDPARPSGRGRLPRRAVRRLAERPDRQQRPADADPARDHRRHPPRVPRGRRRHHRDQHLQRQRGLAARLRPGGARPTSSTSRRPGWLGATADARRDPRAAAVRRRRARPDHPDRVDLARRQRPRRPQRLLRRAGRGVPRGRPRPGRRRLRPADDRDDLRHPQRQGRDLRRRDALRGARPALAGDHLRHHHRRLRPHPLRPGDRGVLGLRAPRPAARRRPQLRPRRQGDAPLHRRDGAPRRLVRVLLPQRRPAQRVRRVRRGARGDRRDPRPSSPTAASSTSSAAAAAPRPPTSRRSRAPSTGKERRTPAEVAPGHAAVRPRAADHHRRQPLRQRRRAHQHHRLRQVPQPDQGRRLRHRADRRRAAGRERRAGHRRQHGRGHDRRRRRDGPLHQADRQRARHQPGAGDGRLLQVGGHRGRPEERPGQADRQLDLHEGGRGQVPRAGPPGAASTAPPRS